MFPRGRSSVQPIPPLNSSYSCLSFRSVVLSILCRTTVQTSFDRTEIYPTEIQLSELWRSPFSGSFTMMPMFQSSGWVSCSQTLKCQGQTAGMESVSRFDGKPKFCLNNECIGGKLRWLTHFKCTHASFNLKLLKYPVFLWFYFCSYKSKRC